MPNPEFRTVLPSAERHGSSDCPTGINESGNVNGLDLALLLGAWGPCP